MQPQRQRDHALELHRKQTEPVLTRALVEPLLQHCGRHVEKAHRPWLQCAFASEQQASISLRPGTQSSGPQCATGDGVATEAHAGSSRPFFRVCTQPQPACDASRRNVLKWAVTTTACARVAGIGRSLLQVRVALSSLKRARAAPLMHKCWSIT